MRKSLQLVALTTAFTMSMTATLSWAYSGGPDRRGATTGPPALIEPSSAPSPAPSPSVTRVAPALTPRAVTTPTRHAVTTPIPVATDRGSDHLASYPGESAPRGCRTGARLVPTCGILWGVAPGARTEARGVQALAEFERKTGRHQAVFHAYHRGIRQVFPTPQEIAISREPGRKRILLLNWKPESATWAGIARGDRATDEFLTRLAAHIRQNYRERFFFAIHHEAEDQVREQPGSGYTARDYAAMFRHVVKRLRAEGAHNVVTVLVHMAYVPHTTKSWFQHMYPGNDVVDWIGFDTYSYSDPGYGHGDFAELLNRRSASKPNWPGFYNWVTRRHPGKPLMVAEWGVWFSKRNPDHMAEFYREVGDQISRFPKIKAMVHFETPSNHKGQDSSVDSTPDALREYRRLGRLPVFQVSLS
ncbi:glycoside hydrolase family 26 protein [Actinoplanes sp. CA-252034]|uniref:glycoside hydrolase family 26 protein n=1 Tax=Actinoplanes sp. CA-252034 TaxID=3239906 RepID=UPI003D959E28